MSGALLLDKPPGVTSARAVARVKRLLPRGTKVGHTGTLDPLASGLLVLLLGRATRLSRYVTDLDKSYTATARFGATSDTLDAEGYITLLDAPMPATNLVRAALEGFTGEILQVPPMASAVKVGGERLYKRHRRGEEIERKGRAVEIHSFSLIFADPSSQTAAFEIRCGSGTYVRSLISDLAQRLGTDAYLTALRRTRVGHLAAADAPPPEDLSPEGVFNRIIHPKEVLSRLPAVEVSEEEGRAVRNGRRIGASGLRGSFRVERGGELLAVYRDAGADVGADVGADAGARAEVVLCGA